MNVLANIPVWVYFVVVAITFMVVHVLALRADQPKNRARSMTGRVVSSLILLVVLVFLEPTAPASVLLALVGAMVAGFVSGRTATPSLPPRAAGEEANGAAGERADATEGAGEDTRDANG